MAAKFGSQLCTDPKILRDSCLSRGINVDSWWGRANGFDLSPVGCEHGRGWLLFDKADLTALGTVADRDLIFTGTDNQHKYTLKSITLISATCITPGRDGDPLAMYLAHVVDRRFHVARIPVDRAFNVRNADGTAYLVETTNGGTPWTWQEVVDELVTELGEDTAEFVLPFTPDGTPENLTFWGGMAWSALCDVLDRLACGAKYNVETNEFSVVRLGDADTAATSAQTANVGERMWDAYPVDPLRAWRPEKVRVRFLRHPRATDGNSPFYTVDVTLAATTGVVVGSYVQLDDDASALGATGAPTNAAALVTRAAERAADWLRKRSGYGRPLLKVYRDFIPGIVRSVPGATVGGVALDDRGAQMRTEIRSKSDRRLEEWEPLSVLPPLFPDCCAEEFEMDVITDVCIGPLESGTLMGRDPADGAGGPQKITPDESLQMQDGGVRKSIASTFLFMGG